jgi:hypothetical protein
MSETEQLYSAVLFSWGLIFALIVLLAYAAKDTAKPRGTLLLALMALAVLAVGAVVVNIVLVEAPHTPRNEGILVNAGRAIRAIVFVLLVAALIYSTGRPRWLLRSVDWISDRL